MLMVATVFLTVGFAVQFFPPTAVAPEPFCAARKSGVTEVQVPTPVVPTMATLQAAEQEMRARFNHPNFPPIGSSTFAATTEAPGLVKAVATKKLRPLFLEVTSKGPATGAV